MPRINVEEEFWGDQRVERLKEIMGRFAAIGACITAWRLAQKYWNGSCNAIPKEVWDASGMPNELREVGLAFVREGKSGPEVYISGSESHFQWYQEKVESASRAGRVSAQRPRNEKGQLLPKQKPTQVQHESNEIQRSTNETQRSSSSSSSPPPPTSSASEGAPHPDFRNLKTVEGKRVLEPQEIERFGAIIEKNTGQPLRKPDRSMLARLLKIFGSLDEAIGWLAETFERNSEKFEGEAMNAFLRRCAFSEIKKAEAHEI